MSWAPLCGLLLALGPSFPMNTSAHPFISLRFLQARLDGGRQHWRPILLAATEKDLLLFDSVPWTRDAWASPCHSYPLVATRWGKPEGLSRLKPCTRPSGRGGGMNTSWECSGSAVISLWESSRLLGVVGVVWGSDLAGRLVLMKPQGGLAFWSPLPIASCNTLPGKFLPAFILELSFWRQESPRLLPATRKAAGSCFPLFPCTR